MRQSSKTEDENHTDEEWLLVESESLRNGSYLRRNN